MQQATSVASGAPMDGAFAGLLREQPENKQPFKHDDRLRYLFNAGYGNLKVDCNGVWRRHIQRCQITPLINFAVKDLLSNIPEGMLIQNSTEKDKEGRDTYGSYLMYAGLEANRLLDSYGIWGLVEIEEIRGWSVKEAGTLRIDKVFFPDRPEDEFLLAKWKPSHREIKAAINGAKAEIERGEHDLVNGVKEAIASGRTAIGHQMLPNLDLLYLKIAERLLSSVEKAEKHQKRRLNITHRGLKADFGTEDYKRAYDDLDEECLQRTETAKQDAVLEKLSDAALANSERPINIQMAEQKADPSMGLLVEQLREQNRLLQESLQAQREQAQADRDLILAMMKNSGQGSVSSDQSPATTPKPQPNQNKK